MKDFGEIPITRETNLYTGLPEGDDAGYRDVPLSPLDEEHPDPFVRTTMMAVPINAVGRTPRIMRMYPGGIPGAPRTTCVRRPVELALHEASQLLKPYGRDLLILDGFRSAQTQAACWAADYRDALALMGVTHGQQVDVLTLLRAGLKADDNTSYSKVVRDDRFYETVNKFWLDHANEVGATATELQKTANEIDELAVTFLTNLGQLDLRLDESATTAHGNGGAVDAFLVDIETGEPVQFGAPYSYMNPPGTELSPTVVNYFEIASLAEYEAAVEADLVLREYQSEHGIDRITERVFRTARRERRLLFHAMRAVGAPYFSLAR
ncbi:MAG: hypothetical protein AAB390_03980, partial [Patescibacteria group bacterium]